MIFRFITEFWRKRQRQIDRDILWPQIKAMGPERDLAERAFIKHMLQDPAYSDWPIEDMREYARELP